MIEKVQRDYYEVLGVPRDADEKTIKHAFRTLAMKYHPDRNPAPDAEERFKEVAKAYAVLSDPKKRENYDHQGFAGVAGFTHEDLFGGMNLEDILGGFSFGGGGFFDQIFGRRSGASLRGQNVEVELLVPLSRIVTGGEEQVRVTNPVACSECKGSGAKPGTKPRICEDCHGAGRKATTRRQGKEGSSILFQQISACDKCLGKGKFIDSPCEKCQGTGQTLQGETLLVSVPVGAREGMALRIPGHGMPSTGVDGKPGDLLVVIRTTNDPRFVRDGADLWHSAIINATDAVLGTELEVPTLDGHIQVKVPAGTQPETTLRIRGKGLPEFGGKGMGDLFLRLHVHIPEALSEQARALYEELKKLDGSRKIS